jgi:putative membrane protein
MWWDHDVGWAGWLMMWIGMGGFWLLVALVVVALVRNGGRPRSQEPTAQVILERRLASGEIDLDEYQQRLAALNQTAR